MQRRALVCDMSQSYAMAIKVSHVQIKVRMELFNIYRGMESFFSKRVPKIAS